MSRDPLDSLFKALSDPTRRQVVERLTKAPASVSELAEPFDMALPSFVQHLRVLEDASVVESTKVGRTRTYKLRAQGLEPVADWLEEQRQQWERRLNALDSYLLALKATSKEANDDHQN